MPHRLEVLNTLGLLVSVPKPDAFPAIDLGDQHTFSGHNPSWEFQKPFAQRPFENKEILIYETLPTESTPEQVSNKTKLVCFIGALDSPQFRFHYENPDTAVLIFEPDKARLSKFADQFKPPELQKNQVFIFLGGVHDFMPPLSTVLPAELFGLGFPVFYILDGLRQEMENYVDEVIQYVENLFYRYRIYPLSSHSFISGRPYREMVRELFYDQLHHAYENIPEFLTCPPIQALRNSFRGHSALLVAAGPALEQGLDILRTNQDKCLIICVNNALRALQAKGIEPHFLVVNDNSLVIGKDSYADIQPPKRTILVGHCFSDLGGNLFRKKFIFGGWVPEVFGARANVRLHGSVISTAFSLAKYLGCKRCGFIGTQLASSNPWGMDYALDSHGTSKRQDRPLSGKYPQRMPVTTPMGETLYTSLNFLDAALWLRDEIRTSGVECINTLRQSILHGPGIGYDENFTCDSPEDMEEILERLTDIPPRPVDLNRVRDFISSQMAKWENTSGPIDQIMALEGSTFLKVGMDALRQLDQGNASYLVQRFEGFNNTEFHSLVFTSNNPVLQEKGLRYYFSHVKQMAEKFLKILRGLEPLP